MSEQSSMSRGHHGESCNCGLADELQETLDELDEHAFEITQAYEELAFVRELTDRLHLSEVSQSPRRFPEDILPALPERLQAESVAMFGVETDEQTGQSPRSGELIVVAGQRPRETNDWRSLIDQYREQAEHGPVVVNPSAAGSHLINSPDVSEFILVQMGTADELVGWLLAVNRIQERLFGTENAHLTRLEFGSIEARLLNSTASVLATHAKNLSLFREKEETFLRAVRSLVSAVDAKDPYTCGHSERVGLLGKTLGRQLGLDSVERQRLYLAGLLHDVGKIAIRGETLRKPGRLTDEEFSEIKRHPECGWAIVHELDALQHVVGAVIHHHERFDGKGYPDGLPGEAIPLSARILAVADTYDALTSDRPYRQGMPQEKAEAILQSGSGSQWDPRVIEAAFEIMPELIEIRQNYHPKPVPQRKPAPEDAKPTEGVAAVAGADTTSSRGGAEPL
ncbi:MAG: HD-GYP domain-containing protein [Planctomycetota bacterium]